MYFERFYDDRLAQASYLVGCQASGEALVVDPARSVEKYLKSAEKQGLRIVGVTETHIHADFLSGTRELAHRTGARMYLSKEGGSDWQARHYFLGYLEENVEEIPSHSILHCQTGIRSLIASSLLERAGKDVEDVVGGYPAIYSARKTANKG